MNNSFLEVMEAHPDKKLREIVEVKRADYSADALAAAEFVLRKRNIKFKEAEPDEHIEMTYEEIREDIDKRRKKGESMNSIRADYRAAGVDIDSREIKGEQPSQPWSFGKIRALAFLVGMAGAALVNYNDHGMSEGLMIVLGVLTCIAAVWVYFEFRK